MVHWIVQMQMLEKNVKNTVASSNLLQLSTTYDITKQYSILQVNVLRTRQISFIHLLRHISVLISSFL